MGKGLWDRFLDWLERVLPTAIAFFSVGFKRGQGGKKEVENKLVKTEYELEKMRNAEKIEEENSGKSSRDIVDDYMRERKSEGDR